MKKFIVLALCAAMSFVGTQAFGADTSLAGYYRMQGISMANANGAPVKDAKSVNFMESRLRLKSTTTVAEGQGFVWYGEVDGTMGETANIGTSGYGVTGGDQRAVIETKNLYGFFSLGDWDVKMGLMALADNLDGHFLDRDEPAIVVSTDLSGAKLTLLTIKTQENLTNADDDVDTYGVQYVRDMDGMKVASDVYYTRNLATQGNEVDQYALGFKVSGIDAGVAKIEAAVLYQGGENVATATTTQDISAWLAMVKADSDFGAVRFVYSPADTDATDDNTFTTLAAGTTYWAEGLNIFAGDIYVNNAANSDKAYKEALNAGYGLMALTYAGKADLGDDVYVNYAAGYFMAADDTANDNAATKVKGTDLGAEVAVKVGKKIDKVDLSVRASYAMLGDRKSVV